MKTAPFAWSLVGMLLFTGVARAQSLGEIARKEEERRKAVKGTGKVYTNEDLRRYPGLLPSAQPAPPAEPAAVAAPGDKEGETAGAAKASPSEEKGEAEWRRLITEAREKLERSKSFLEALQSQVNALTADFYARDDPAQRAALWSQRTKALEEMERVNKEIVEHNKAIATIEEDARKAGVPPGWLR